MILDEQLIDSTFNKQYVVISHFLVVSSEHIYEVVKKSDKIFAS